MRKIYNIHKVNINMTWRKWLKINGLLLPIAMLASPFLVCAANSKVEYLNQVIEPKEEIDDVWQRFLNDVDTKHQALLDSFINNYQLAPKSSQIQPWAGGFVGDNLSGAKNTARWEGRDNWRSRYGLSSQNFYTKDIYGNYFTSNKPRIVTNQNVNLSASTFISSINNVGDFWESGTDDNGWDVDHHNKAASAWAQDGHLPAFQKVGLDNLFEVNKKKINVNFDEVNLKFQTMADLFMNRHIHKWDFRQKSEEEFQANHNCLYRYAGYDGVKQYIGNNFLCKATQYFQAYGQTVWFYQLANNYLNIDFMQYGLNNVFSIDDFGFDNDIGYYFTLGINKQYLKAAEGERNNPQTQTQWDSELVNGNRVLWINPNYVSSQPAWQQQRDTFFSEVQTLINQRLITYDNYSTVRSFINNYCLINHAVPANEWLTNQFKTNTDITNNGWVELSEKFNLTGYSQAWDKLLLLLPELNYSIKLDRNAVPEDVSHGTWTGWTKTKSSFSWDELKQGVKQTIGPDANSIAFKANCDILSEENKNQNFNIDTWRSDRNINKDGEIETIDANLVKENQDVDFIYDNTVAIIKDPLEEFSDKDTYWKFDKNLKKICMVENEPNKDLHITIVDKQNLLPTEVWDALSGSISEKLKKIIADENNQPASVYAYKDINQNLNYDLPDNYFKVICHNDAGKIEVRLINPNTNEIVYSTNLTGFKQNESGGEIIFKFNTPFKIGTDKTSSNLEVTLANEISGSILDYVVNDGLIAEVNKVQSDGRKITIKGLNKGSTNVNVSLWDSTHSYVIAANIFNIIVDTSPEKIVLNEPFNKLSIKQDESGKANDAFSATIQPSGSSQAVIYQLIGSNLPSWLTIDYDGFINWKQAKAGNYVFNVQATSEVDVTVNTTSKVITLVVDDGGGGGMNTTSLGLILGTSIGAGVILTSFIVYMVKRRRK